MLRTTVPTHRTHTSSVAAIVMTILALTAACVSVETGGNTPSPSPSSNGDDIIGSWTGNCAGTENLEFRNDGTLVMDGDEVRWFRRDSRTMVVTTDDDTTHVVDFRVEGDRLALTGDLLSSCTLTRGAAKSIHTPTPSPEAPNEPEEPSEPAPAPDPCPSTVAAELPPGAGPGSTLIAAYLSADFEITLCSDATGQVYYHGAGRVSGNSITLPAQYENGAYMAQDGSYLYQVRDQRIMVTNDGEVLVDQPLERIS